ncbi:MAG: phosphoadenosine phosphosulfate reductase family protein, partial [Candidatus Lokiarchaeota archaeon]|nr:phosphoadenosine phosphosulfate reductase family protein [Candidatus Lokiarchaeota archaeon]
FIIKKAPAKNIYYSIARWLNPENVGPRSKKNRCLGAKLVFDFDVIDNILDLNEFEMGKTILIECKNYLNRQFGFSEFEYLWTGNKGFHLIVQDYNYREFFDEFVKGSQTFDLERQKISEIEILNRNYIYKKIKKKEFPTDYEVLTDIMRVVRLPKTLHGSTGLQSILVSSEKKFKRLNIDESFTMIDNYDLKLFFTKNVPEFSINDLIIGPYNKGTIKTISSRIGCFLILKNFAKLVSRPKKIQRNELKKYIWLENSVRWCPNCNIPIIESKSCPVCENYTFKVRLHGVGDARPAFDINKIRIREIIDSKFGENSGKVLIPSDRIILLNRVPRIKSRQIEIIIDGRVIGRIKFNINDFKFEFLPKIAAGKVLYENNFGKWIKIKQSIKLSVFKFLSSKDIMESNFKSYQDGEIVFIVQDNELIAMGRLRKEINSSKDTKKIQILKIDRDPPKKMPIGGQTWSDVVEANLKVIRKYENEAILFINSIRNYYRNKKITIPFSGGKDSLVVVSLVSKALDDFQINYVRSEIEFPETNKFVKYCIRKMGLEDKFVEIKVDNKLESLSKLLGPPQIDNNWCVNIYKLGPTNKLYEKHFSDGGLSFVGLRSYESNNRVLYYRLNLNPWFPSNILNIHPIYDWNALLIWLYIFQNDLPINPIYKEYGRERCGCWICPHQGLSNLFWLKKDHDELWNLLINILKEYQSNIEAPDEWISHGLWRWRNPPPKVKNWAEINKVSLNYLNNKDILESDILKIQSKRKIEENKFEIKGQIINLKKINQIKNILNILGNIEEDFKDGSLIIFEDNRHIKIYRSGAFKLIAKNQVNAEKVLKNFKYVIIRSRNCIGCLNCVTLCKQNAVNCINSEVPPKIDPKKCTHCLECNLICPLIKYKIIE